MKYTLMSTAVAALFCTTSAIAQTGPLKKIVPVVTLGVKAGVNLQQANGSAFNSSYAAGILGGAFVGVSKKKMGVRVEGLVKSAKIDVSAGAGTATINTVGIDIPVLFEYSLIKRLKLHVGPQFTTILSAKSGGADVKNTIASSDISLAAGAEVHLPLKLTIGARYIKGLTDQDKLSVGKWTTSTIQLTVGYRFLN
ncbi:MAG: PorT family protein [Taibaiella sp.]|nr:PorT family protein [Taibaiella sp.]